jgi:hypothetical protein
MTPIEIGAIATAGFGAVTGFWGQIRGMFSRFESLFIAEAIITSTDLNFMICTYLKQNYKKSRTGVRNFYSDSAFLKPLKRVARIAIENPGHQSTFWNGIFPLFLSIDKDSGNSHITFLRGTWNLDEMIKEATIHYRDDSQLSNNRFCVQKFYGKNKNDIALGKKSQSEPDITGSIDPTRFAWVVGWKQEELGELKSSNPFDALAYEEDVENFIKEVTRWKESKQWFLDKKIPWRLGAGLFGPPGTGKSSLARAIAQSLDIPIHMYDLTTMTNEEFNNYWKTSLDNAPCMVLFEDLDRIFDEKKQIKAANNTRNPLTLDVLLNCISGVQNAEGIVTIVTANDPSKLDEAIGVPDGNGKSTRNGRLDVFLNVDVLSENQRKKIAARILSDVPELIDHTVKAGTGETGAQFENRCSKLALSRYWKQKK